MLSALHRLARHNRSLPAHLARRLLHPSAPVLSPCKQLCRFTSGANPLRVLGRLLGGAASPRLLLQPSHTGSPANQQRGRRASGSSPPLWQQQLQQRRCGGPDCSERRIRAPRHGPVPGGACPRRASLPRRRCQLRCSVCSLLDHQRGRCLRNSLASRRTTQRVGMTRFLWRMCSCVRVCAYFASNALAYLHACMCARWAMPRARLPLPLLWGVRHPLAPRIPAHPSADASLPCLALSPALRVSPGCPPSFPISPASPALPDRQTCAHEYTRISRSTLPPPSYTLSLALPFPLIPPLPDQPP